MITRIRKGKRMIGIDQVRVLYEYHYALHYRVWDSIMTLDDAAFVTEVPYSIGSLRNHVVHLASVDQRWFARVVEQPLMDRLSYEDYPTRAAAREAWDASENYVRAALDQLTDEDLLAERVFQIRRVDPAVHMIEATNTLWQIMLHVVNHGTDHRAQMLRILHDFGAPTFENDMIIHWWDMVE